MADRDTEDRILDAAHTVFLQRGTAGARMQEVADEAGVNKALLHYYFRDKDTLAGAVFEREFRRLVRPVMATLGSDLPLEDKVRRTVELYVDGLSDFPLMPGYVLAEIHFHPERMEDFLSSVAARQPARVLQGLGSGHAALFITGRQYEQGAGQGIKVQFRQGIQMLALNDAGPTAKLPQHVDAGSGAYKRRRQPPGAMQSV